MSKCGFSCSARRELVFDRGPRECRTLQSTLQRRNSQGGAIFWMKLDQERKQKMETENNILHEIQNMVSDRTEPTEIKFRRQIHLELSSLQSVSTESSFRSESNEGQTADEAKALLLIAKKLEKEQGEKREFELRYLPGTTFLQREANLCMITHPNLCNRLPSASRSSDGPDALAWSRFSCTAVSVRASSYVRPVPVVSVHARVHTAER